MDARGKLVALVGVKDLVIVDTPDALLVVDRNQAQKVGDVVKLLKQKKRRIVVASASPPSTGLTGITAGANTCSPSSTPRRRCWR